MTVDEGLRYEGPLSIDLWSTVYKKNYFLKFSFESH